MSGHTESLDEFAVLTFTFYLLKGGTCNLLTLEAIQIFKKRKKKEKKTTKKKNKTKKNNNNKKKKKKKKKKKTFI